MLTPRSTAHAVELSTVNSGQSPLRAHHLHGSLPGESWSALTNFESHSAAHDVQAQNSNLRDHDPASASFGRISNFGHIQSVHENLGPPIQQQSGHIRPQQTWGSVYNSYAPPHHVNAATGDPRSGQQAFHPTLTGMNNATPWNWSSAPFPGGGLEGE